MRKSSSLIFIGLCMSWNMRAAEHTLTFKLNTPAQTAAVQFDIPPVQGGAFSNPVMENAPPHIVDSARLADGTQRFVIFSATNAPISQDGTLKVRFSFPSTPASGVLTVKNVLATTNGADSLSPAPNILPVILSAAPAAGTTVTSGPAAWAVETFDPDGRVSSVSFLWNGSQIDSDTSAPYGGAFTAATGHFTAAFIVTDNTGGQIRLEGPEPVTVITSGQTDTWSGFQSAYFPAGTDSRPSGDPFGLGIPNLIAYAIGLNPSAPDRALYPSFNVETENGQAAAVYRVDLKTGAGVTASFEVSESLSGGWRDAPAAWIRQSGQPGGKTRHELRIPLSGPEDRTFGRLRLTL